MQQPSSLERVPMGGLVAAAVILGTLASTWHASAPPPPPPAPSSVEQPIAQHRFGTARRVLLLQRRAECAEATRQLELVYHVAMAPDTEVMEAFVAAQAAIALDGVFGGPLGAELAERRAAVAAAAARAYDARGLDAWARQASQFAR